MVAVNMERRHEFNAEFSLFYDLKRTGMVEEFINLEYPKGVGTAPGSDAAYQDWRTYRTYLIITRIRCFIRFLIRKS